MAPTHARLALMCVVAFAWTPSHTATSLGSMWERVWHPLDGPSVSASASTSRRLSATAPGNPGVEVKYVHGETVPKFSISVGDTSCPKNLDWRDLGAVTPVRDQGECAASWAFAAISAVESAHFIATKELVSMSVQQLIDCDTANTGCAGGDPALALDYLMQKTPGVVHEAEYPFMTEAAVCRVDTTHRVAEIVSNVEYLPMNEGDLKSAVCNQPVVIFMGVDPALTGFSGGGIFEASAPKECGETISHAVLLVGYGTTDDGEEYWLAKSSWRGEMANIADWGDGGFFKFPRGVGFCGMLAVNPVIPIVASSVSFTTALEECPIVDHTVEAGDTPHSVSEKYGMAPGSWMADLNSKVKKSMEENAGVVLLEKGDTVQIPECEDSDAMVYLPSNAPSAKTCTTYDMGKTWDCNNCNYNLAVGDTWPIIASKLGTTFSETSDALLASLKAKNEKDLFRILNSGGTITLKDVRRFVTLRVDGCNKDAGEDKPGPAVQCPDFAMMGYVAASRVDYAGGDLVCYEETNPNILGRACDSDDRCVGFSWFKDGGGCLKQTNYPLTPENMVDCFYTRLNLYRQTGVANMPSGISPTKEDLDVNCALACVTDEDCGFWSFDLTTSECYHIPEGPVSLKLDKNVNSGPSGYGCGVYRDTEYAILDEWVSIPGTLTATPESCAKACQSSTTQCAVWMHDDGHCYMSSNQGNSFKASPGVSSGHRCAYTTEALEAEAPLSVSTDGLCGADNGGQACLVVPHSMGCCNKNGQCFSGPRACGDGCKDGFGYCGEITCPPIDGYRALVGVDQPRDELNCFFGVSREQLADECESNSDCVGFSVQKDTFMINQGGCLKFDHGTPVPMIGIACLYMAYCHDVGSYTSEANKYWEGSAETLFCVEGEVVDPVNLAAACDGEPGCVGFEISEAGNKGCLKKTGGSKKTDTDMGVCAYSN